MDGIQNRAEIAGQFRSDRELVGLSSVVARDWRHTVLLVCSRHPICGFLGPRLMPFIAYHARDGKEVVDVRSWPADATKSALGPPRKTFR
jgi:hypothetical protein